MLALLLSTLRPAFAGAFALVNVQALPVSSPPIEGASVIVRDGRIEAIGVGLPLPAGIEVVDGGGGWLLPGIIDVHSHMGVYSWPGARAHSDGNEATDPVTARVRAEDSVHVEDPAFAQARAGGVTTVQILPGSANLVGGESVVLKLRPSRTLAGMRFAQAPRGIKMACGENPKRVYQGDIDGPSTRMGNIAAMRQAFQAALDYRQARRSFRDPPPVDHDLQTLLDVLDGRVLVHVHCYRADDIEGLFRVMDEFGVQVTSIQHSLEAYKVRDLLAAHGTGIATWPDWWGFKMEAWDAIPHNAALVKSAGVPVALHSDSANVVQRMYTEAAKVLRYGMSEQDALTSITLDPARLLGIDGLVGSLEPGKQADFALYSKHPLDVTTRVQKTWIDGVAVYDRSVEEAADAAR